MARNEKKLRGIFEMPPDSGIFYIQYFDVNGNRRREKVARRSDAITLLGKRKTEKLQGKKLPENLRKGAVPFKELLDDALEISRAENGAETTYNHGLKFEVFREHFGNRPAESISKQEIVRFLLDLADEREWSPASFNRWQTSISFVFRVGVENEKIAFDPASKIKKKTENNAFAFSPIARRRLSFDTSTSTTRSTNPRFSLAFTLESERGSSFGCNGRI
jgi:hypothetical protein